MAEAKLSIDEAVLNGAIAKAILEGIGPEQREQVFQQAIVSAITVRRDTRYGVPVTSPLQDAMRDAVQVEVGRVAREIVAADEGMQTRIREVVAEAVAQLLSDGSRGELVEAMRRTVGETFASFRPDRY